MLLQAVNATTHLIKKGDTLYSLGRAYGVDVKEIQKVNPGLDEDSLKIGMAVVIPDVHRASSPEVDVSQNEMTSHGDKSGPVTPEICVVKKGDTLSGISRQTGVSPAELMRLNGLSDNRLRVGQNLRIRTSGVPRALKVESGRRPEESAGPKYFFVSKVQNKIDAPKMGSRIWRYIVVHHSGTGSGSARIFEYYHRQVRGMENGMAYHFVIGNGSDSGDGEIEVGNRWLRQLQGGHLKSDEQDEVAIGICLVGDFNKTRPTRNQLAALIELVTCLESKIGRIEHIKPNFVVHRDINIRPTECPGKYFPAEAMYKLFGKWTGER